MSKIYALLVGVQTYENPAIRRLFGCEYDVMRMERYLKQHTGNPDIVTLKSREATRKNIIATFRQHLNKAGKDDIALFYFSGHGTLETPGETFAKFPNNGVHEAIVAYDSYHNNTWGIVDKELRYLVHEVSQRCDHVVAICDCCHSGDNTRFFLAGTHARPRIKSYLITELDFTTPRPWNEYIFSNEISEEQVLNASSLNMVLPEGKHILLAACESSQVAVEVGSSGLFTQSLLQTLRTSGGQLSYADLMSRVQYHVRAVYNQTPSFHSQGIDMTQLQFLGGSLSVRAANANMVFHTARNTWLLDKGSAHGVKMNDAVEILEEGNDKAIATAVITKTFFGAAELNPQVTLPNKNAYAVSSGTLFKKSLSLFLTGDPEGAEILQNYFYANGNGNGLELVTCYEEADYLISAENTGNGSASGPAPSYIIMSPFTAGYKIPLVSPVAGYSEASCRNVAAAIRKIAKWEFVKNLPLVFRPTTSPLQLTLHRRDGKTEVVEGNRDILWDFEQYGEGGRVDLSVALRHAGNVSAKYYGALLFLDPLFGIKTDLLGNSSNLVFDEKHLEYTAFDGEFFSLNPYDYVKKYDLPSQAYHFIVLISEAPFDVWSFEQEPLPEPGKEKMGETVTETENTHVLQPSSFAFRCTLMLKT